MGPPGRVERTMDYVEYAEWIAEHEDDFIEDYDPYTDLENLCDCGQPGMSQCACCGAPLCHQCAECGGNFCRSCIRNPHFSDMMERRYGTMY